MGLTQTVAAPDVQCWRGMSPFKRLYGDLGLEIPMLPFRWKVAGTCRGRRDRAVSVSRYRRRLMAMRLYDSRPNSSCEVAACNEILSLRNPAAQDEPTRARRIYGVGALDVMLAGDSLANRQVPLPTQAS